MKGDKCLKCNRKVTGRRENYCSDRCKILRNIKKNSMGCWEWKKSVRKDGYASSRWSGSSTIYVHRLSYLTFKGTIPEKILVCHHCDNRKCVNPDHLFLGTHSDNFQDADKKGRNQPLRDKHPLGSNHGNAKLTESDIPHIIQALKDGTSHEELSQKYGVSKAVISEIRNGKLWKHITKGETFKGKKLREADVKEILLLLKNKESMVAIASKFNVDKSSIWLISKNKSWKSIPREGNDL